MVKNIYRGLILVSPHGTYIKDGLKTTVIKSVKLKNIHDKPLLLIENKKGLGILELSEPIEITLDQFKKRYKQHRITEKERLEWWKGKKVLFEHDIKKKKFYREPIELDYKTGPQIVVKPKNIKYLESNYQKKYDLWKTEYLDMKKGNHLSLDSNLQKQKILGGQLSIVSLDSNNKRKNVEYEKIMFKFIKHYDSEYCQIEDQIKELYNSCNPYKKNKDKDKSFVPKDLPAWVILAFYKHKIQGFMFLIKAQDLLNFYKKKGLLNPEKKLENHIGLPFKDIEKNIKSLYYVGYICENSFKYQNIINSLFRFFFEKEFENGKNRNWLMIPLKLNIVKELSSSTNRYYLHVKPENRVLINTYELYGFRPTNKKYKDRIIFTKF